MSISGDEQGAQEAHNHAEEAVGEPGPAQAQSLIPRTISAGVSSGGPVVAIRPTTLEETWRLATAVVRAGLAPYGMGSVEACVVAMVHGSEVGLPAMASLQSIAVINNKPSLYGDGALGVIRASNRLEYIRESYRDKDETAVCVIKRRGEPAITRRFSRADAELAKLWGKRTNKGDPTPWVTYPKRMLAMRARAFAMRDAFADVLKGMAIAEEMMDVEPRTNGAGAKVVSPAMVEEDATA